MRDDLFEVTMLGDSERRYVSASEIAKEAAKPLPRIEYRIAEDLIGEKPPASEAQCGCGKPADTPVQWEGCKYCGGGDCGDYPDVSWICQDCYANGR